jgi:hypothetical protein
LVSGYFLIHPIKGGVKDLFYALKLYITIIIIIIIFFSCHRPFLSGTSLELAVPPPLRLQVSHCSTFRNMFDVPNIAVFCNGYIELLLLLFIS